MHKYFEAKSKPKHCLDICAAKRNEGLESTLEVKANGLKDLQKQKYGTSHLLLGVHGVRMEIGSRTGTALELLDMEPSNDDT